MNDTILSIIIVNYHVKKELFACLSSIEKAEINFEYEIIVIDNDEQTVIKKELKEKFPKVKYVKTLSNKGFGAGNNEGAKYAGGKYLFFLNPDTLIYPNCCEKLINFFKTQKNIGIVAPLLLDENEKPYKLQGTENLGVLEGAIALSFINKLFPKNQISGKYWQLAWDHKTNKKSDTVPGTAMVISKNLFEKIGGFDENFFLYFEEHDLCKRVKALGYKIFIIPKARVFHAWGRSTQMKKDKDAIFSKSRFYYFKKHYGFFTAILINFLLSFKKKHIFFGIIFIVGVFLRFYNLQNNFYFDGEIGDNLLDIKNAYLSHKIPLLGPPTSHSWLYFGPLFYWIYGPILILSGFNPLSYAYFGASGSIIIVVANYLVTREIFNTKVALLSSFFIAISPLFLEFSLRARFFSLVPLIVYPFLLLIYKTTNKKKYFFILGILFGVMLNLHYSSLILLPFLVSFLFLNKVKVRIKDFFKFLLGTVIPLAPFFIYDSMHGLRMSLNLLVWIPYRIIGFLGIYHKNTFSGQVFGENVLSFEQYFSSTLINPHVNIGYLFATMLTVYIFYKLFIMYRIKKIQKNFLLIFLWGGWGVMAVFIHGNPPSHYFVPILGFPIVLLSLFIDDLMNNFKPNKAIVLIILFAIMIVNLHFFFSKYWFYRYKIDPFPYKDRVAAVKFIIAKVKQKKFTLKRIGYNGQFRLNYAQNYIYLLWYYGNEPVTKAKLHYIIYDKLKPENLPINKSTYYISPNIIIVQGK